MRRASRAFALVACVVVASLGGACGAFTSADPPVTPPDASAATDGGVEESALDSATPDGGGTGSCPEGAVFCDDFERGPTEDSEIVRGNWQRSTVKSGSLATLAVDGTRVLALDVAPSEGTPAEVFLERDTQAAPKGGLELRFRFRIARAPQAQLQIASLTLRSGGVEQLRVSLELTQNQLGVQERVPGDAGDIYGQLVQVGNVAPGRWNDIKVWIEAPSSSGGRFRASIGAVESGGANGGPLTRQIAPESGTVTLGDKRSTSPDAGAQLRFDDVVVLGK